MSMLTQRQRWIGIFLGTAGLLLIPFFAMQFTDQVNWSPLDFVAMGFLLLAAGFSGDFVLLRKEKSLPHRLLLLLGVVALFFLLWAELAVGIFGTPLAGS